LQRLNNAQQSVHLTRDTLAQNKLFE